MNLSCVVVFNRKVWLLYYNEVVFLSTAITVNKISAQNVNFVGQSNTQDEFNISTYRSQIAWIN